MKPNDDERSLRKSLSTSRLNGDARAASALQEALERLQNMASAIPLMGSNIPQEYFWGQGINSPITGIASGLQGLTGSGKSVGKFNIGDRVKVIKTASMGGNLSWSGPLDEIVTIDQVSTCPYVIRDSDPSQRVCGDQDCFELIGGTMNKFKPGDIAVLNQDIDGSKKGFKVRILSQGNRGYNVDISEFNSGFSKNWFFETGDLRRSYEPPPCS